MEFSIEDTNGKELKSVMKVENLSEAQMEEIEKSFNDYECRAMNIKFYPGFSMNKLDNISEALSFENIESAQYIVLAKD